VLVVGLVLLPVIVVLLFMVAANASFDPARIVTLEGVTVIPVLLLPSSGASGEPSLPCFVPRPEQPLSSNIRSTACVFQIRFTDMPHRTSTTNTTPHDRRARALHSHRQIHLELRVWALLLGYTESRKCVWN
jgi:hypothetical protein